MAGSSTGVMGPPLYRDGDIVVEPQAVAEVDKPRNLY